MSCSRCEDVHKAQCEGKTQLECKCSCHNSQVTTTTGGYWNITGFGTSATNDADITFNDTNATTVTLSTNGDFLNTKLNINSDATEDTA